MKSFSLNTFYLICGLMWQTDPVYGFSIEKELPLPDWLTLSSVGVSMEVNGLSSKIYQINSRHNATKTGTQLQDSLAESTVNQDFPVHQLTWNDHIIITQFRPPVFITIELTPSDFSSMGTLLMSNLETINRHWKTKGFPLENMNNLSLIGRITDHSSQSKSDTFTLNSQAGFRSSFNQLSTQAQHENWQISEYVEQTENQCHIGFLVRPNEKLYLSSCKKDNSGSQINLVWEQY